MLGSEVSTEIIPVVVAVVAFVAAVYAAWARDRNNPMAQTVTAANDTTAQLQAFADLTERQMKAVVADSFMDVLQAAQTPQPGDLS